jgi:glycosyltransferase involved in cell wall biosynthesis
MTSIPRNRGDRQGIKVLYCILDSRCGGPHRRAHAVSVQLRTQQVETLFLLGQKPGEIWQPEGFASFVCKHLQCFWRQAPARNFLRFCAALPGNLLRIRRIIQSHGIDVVHVDGVTNFVPALAGRLAGRPVIWLCNDYLPGPLRRLLLPLVDAWASTLVVQGRCLQESLTVGRPRLRHKTIILYSAIDTAKFVVAENADAQRRRIRQELGIPAPCTVIGTVENVHPLKGYTYLLQAASKIKKATGPVKFLVVGRKLDTARRYWDHLQRLTARLGLERDVIYAGFRDDIPAILSALDLFVLPSLWESCPVALLEAVAMKVPVVATDVGAVREIVTDGQTGFVVPPRDAAALARAVLAYLALPEDGRREMVAAGRKRIENSFSAGTMAQQQYQVYQRVLQRDRARETPDAWTGPGQDTYGRRVCDDAGDRTCREPPGEQAGRSNAGGKDGQ